MIGGLELAQEAVTGAVGVGEVWGWNAAVQAYEVITNDSDFEAGQGYWIRTTVEDLSISLAPAGDPGRGSPGSEATTRFVSLADQEHSARAVAAAVVPELEEPTIFDSSRACLAAMGESETDSIDQLAGELLAQR
jgi:hypothetical protein